MYPIYRNLSRMQRLPNLVDDALDIVRVRRLALDERDERAVVDRPPEEVDRPLDVEAGAKLAALERALQDEPHGLAALPDRLAQRLGEPRPERRLREERRERAADAGREQAELVAE